MGFKKKPTKVVGISGWEVEIPQPPVRATHVRITCISELKGNGTPKKAIVAIRDFGVLRGVAGEFQFIRMDKRKKLLEEYDGVWEWDGRKVVGIEEMRQQ